MDLASLQVDLEKHVTLELTLFGTSNQISSSETEIKHYTFLVYWSHIMGMPLMIRLFSELVREYLAKALRVCSKKWELKTVEPLWL